MDAAAIILQLAARSTSSDKTSDVMIYGGLAVLLIIAGIAVVAMLRKRLLGEDSSFDIEGNFSLSDLRQLLADGRISQDEFDRAKEIVLARSREMLREAEADSDKG